MPLLISLYTVPDIFKEMVDEADPIDQVLNSFDRWLDEEGLRDRSFIFVTCGDWDLQTQLRNEAINKNLALPSFVCLFLFSDIQLFAAISRHG